MAQLDIPALVAKVKSLEAALPGFCDKAIAELTAVEGNMIGNFIFTHIGISDPKAVEEELISALKMVKSFVGKEAAYVDAFLELILSLAPAKVAS